MDKTITLKNNKTLGYAEYGDSKGKPLFFFHGWPSSRLQAKILDQTGIKQHIRIISVDRPGYGLSEFDPNRTLLDWPDTIIELADTLHIKKFAVIGVSGGGPYAAVCAYKIPDRVTKAGIVVGLSPTNIAGVLQGMKLVNKFLWNWYHYIPFLMDLSSFVNFIHARKYLPDIFIPAYRAKEDRRLMSPKIKQDIEANREQAFVQGKKGAHKDLELYTNAWGFDLSQIKTKVFLWYGAVDKNVSVNMGHYYHAQIPKSNLIIYPKEGHFILLTHKEEILQTLTS